MNNKDDLVKKVEQEIGLDLSQPMDFDTLYKHREALVELVRQTKMKYEVPLKIRDHEHYVEVVKNVCETVSRNISDWGFTTMAIMDMKNEENKLGVTTSIFIFKDMPEDFDPQAYGMHLTLL